MNIPYVYYPKKIGNAMFVKNLQVILKIIFILIVKNVNIISVFSHLAEYPQLLEKIFEDNTVNDIGIYKVKLFVEI